MNQVVIAAIRRRQAELPTRRRVPPPIKFPIGIEREYRRELRSIVKLFFQTVDEVISPQLEALVLEAQSLRPDRLDNYARTIEQLIEATNVLFERRSPSETVIAERYANAVASNNMSQLNIAARAAVGVDILLSEPYLPAMLQSFTAENVKLIKDISARELTQIEGVLQRGLTQGQSRTQISREIRGRTGIATRRADLIARDQIATLNGQLSKTRMLNLGVTRARWITAGDERVRPEHQARDNQIYDVNEGIDGEFPGSEISCRCISQPLLEDLLPD